MPSLSCWFYQLKERVIHEVYRNIQYGLSSYVPVEVRVAHWLSQQPNS